jgi:hypothetical protein
MIDPKELRIGNLIMLDGKILPVHSLDEQIGTYENGFGSHYYSGQAYQSIPLTEEWLIKLGLIKDRAPNCYILGDFILFTKNEANEIYSPYFAAGKYMKCISFVHELQNSYYILTNQELTIHE